MQTGFHFQITNTKKKYYTLIANLLLLVSFSLYSLYQYNLHSQHLCTNTWKCLILPNLILAIFLVRFFFVVTKQKLEFTNFHFAILSAICWLSVSHWMTAAIILCLGILEYLVNKDAFCRINENGITLSSFPKRTYKWKALANVVLKEGIFTIDQKNNKIFQIDVSEENLAFPEESLNNFTAKMLS
jgi:hypothetical protein